MNPLSILRKKVNRHGRYPFIRKLLPDGKTMVLNKCKYRNKKVKMIVNQIVDIANMKLCQEW
jgi:hypothetical protein